MQLNRKWLKIYPYLILLTVLLGSAHGSEWEGADGNLRSASYDGDLSRVIQALDSGANINGQSRPDKPTALMYAARNGHIGIAKLLLRRGADPNIQSDQNEMTAFGYSLDNNHQNIAILLIENGAKPLPWGYHSLFRPLPISAKKGYSDLVGLLLKHGVDVNDRVEQNKMTALMIASDKGHTEIVKILLDHHADVNLISSGGYTALDFADKNKHKEIVSILKSMDAEKKHVMKGDAVENRYKQSLISHISDNILKGQQQRQHAKDLYPWGQEICNSLKSQLPKQVILEESYYQFWGEELSNAMWEAALEVICPEFQDHK